ncbi:MAG: NADPH-dependent FMN reductase [Nitrospinales bacterium]
MSYLVIAASLNPQSRSRILARAARDAFQKRGRQVVLLDLAKHPLPLCDGDAAYNDPNAREVSRMVQTAEGILLATPIYNFDANAAAKNLVELTGNAWQDKVVGFLCAAGGKSSYMSVMSLANSLMLDFRCLILPRFVYATGEAFEGEALIDADVRDRLDDLVGALIELSRATARG